jgi:hypothetical protein
VRFFFSFFLSVSAVAVATVLSVFKLAATIAPAFCFVLFFFFFCSLSLRLPSGCSTFVVLWSPSPLSKSQDSGARTCLYFPRVN